MSEIKWIKVMTNIFDNRKIKQIESLPEGDAIIVIWLKLLCLAGNINNQGYIYFTNEIPYTDEMMANQFNKPINVIRLALKTFQQFEMIEIIDDVIKISNWDKYQNVDGMNKIREQNRARQARFRERERKKLLENKSNVTHNVMVTESNATDKDIDIDKEKEKNKEKNGNNVTHALPKINYQEIVDLYNSICLSFPKVNKLSDTRKKALTARAKIYSLEDFKVTFQKAEASSFLKGKNDRNWIATFDWIIKDSNMAKILDGNYDNRQASGQNKNNFNNFRQNNYDFDALEKKLLDN